jgi:hypothetical protein
MREHLVVEVHGADHVLEGIFGLVEELLDLEIILDLVVLLHVVDRLQKLLAFSASHCGLGVPEVRDVLLHVREPRLVLLIFLHPPGKRPVPGEILRDLLHPYRSLVLILIPALFFVL